MHLGSCLGRPPVFLTLNPITLTPKSKYHMYIYIYGAVLSKWAAQGPKPAFFKGLGSKPLVLAGKSIILEGFRVQNLHF